MNPALKKRTGALRKKLAEKSLDSLMILVAENRYYLSGFSGEDTQFDESAGALFISADKALLATDSRYELQAKMETESCTVFCYREGVAKALPEIARIMGSRRIGFESRRVTFKQHAEMERELEDVQPGVVLVPTENMVEDIRVVKQEIEIDAIRRALAVAEKAFAQTARALQPGMTEKEAAWLAAYRRANRFYATGERGWTATVPTHPEPWYSAHPRPLSAVFSIRLPGPCKWLLK
ncbi:MAG: aminopeptidase P family protein [Deltaproteobacteria bacterium]|nr:aminopeptidase P family protein [Deltaproteobacteria bacterium]